jgi:hypothetical protein
MTMKNKALFSFKKWKSHKIMKSNAGFETAVAGQKPKDHGEKKYLRENVN